MRKLDIQQSHFIAAFERDVDYEEQDSLMAYLDLDTGTIEWLYDDDHDAELYGLDPEENSAQRQCIEAASDRFLQIPGLSHGEHHDILRQFLASNWTNDQELRDMARDAYIGSIGGWKKAMSNEAVLHAYYRFCDDRMVHLAREFLLESGVEVEWT